MMTAVALQMMDEIATEVYDDLGQSFFCFVLFCSVLYFSFCCLFSSFSPNQDQKKTKIKIAWAQEAATLKREIERGIKEYGVVNSPNHGDVYAYEVFLFCFFFSSFFFFFLIPFSTGGWIW